MHETLFVDGIAQPMMFNLKLYGYTTPESRIAMMVSSAQHMELQR